MYSITLAYIVDANVGRSSTAVATNSAFRGVLAFVAAEVAVPLQVSSFHLSICAKYSYRVRYLKDSIHDGGLYSLWAGLLLVAASLVLLVRYKGSGWRADAERREPRA